MQGIFIENDEGAMVRPSSKKQVKEMVKQGSTVSVEATSAFGNEPDGILTKEMLETHGKILFVGPDPYTKRNFYGSISLNKKGDIRVE